MWDCMKAHFLFKIDVGCPLFIVYTVSFSFFCPSGYQHQSRSNKALRSQACFRRPLFRPLIRNFFSF